MDPKRLFGPLVDNYATVCAQPDPLQAEVFTSDMIGAWWRKEFTFADPDAVLGEGVIRQAAVMGTTEAVALLACMRTLAPTVAGRDLAAVEAKRLLAAGVAEPVWAGEVGVVHASKCWYGTDVYDDAPVLLCSFRDAGYSHALVVRIDNTVQGGGFARDIDVIDDLPDVLAELREQVRTSRGTMRLAPISRAKARAAIEKALQRTDSLPDAEVAGTFARYRALALARCRSMPAPQPRDIPSADERAALVDRLMQRSHSVADKRAGLVCARLIVDYGCDVDTGDPLRISPSKIRNFLRRWAPDRPELDSDAVAAMPGMIVDYLNLAGELRRLPHELVDHTQDAAAKHIRRFADTYG